MSSGPSERTSIRLSVLDRLLDDDPTSTAEVPLEETQKLRMLQHAVRRDLQNLLNTRFRCVAWPPQMAELDDSLINYGLPDFTASSLNAAEDSEILVQAVRKAISLFEPRLADVKVERAVSQHYSDRTFHFRIEAMLVIEERQHRVRFDSSLESTTGQFELK